MKSLKILTLRIKIIRTSPKRKNKIKKVLAELIKERGSSVGLKFSKVGQILFELIKGKINLKDRGISKVILLGEKFGTTDEM